ncbi:MAG: ribonuclease P protein component [Mycoplasmataceae bacterium]|jgi:ribonuclease P protein component|nr:ribonuclease P protein component [Mycoplasmataceae bacterium]
MKNKRSVIILKATKCFDRVVNSKNTKSISNSVFKFKYIPNKLVQTRCGLAVSKKKYKTAVLRNKIKRQVRMMMQDILTSNHVDIVVIVKEAYQGNTYQENKKLFIDLYNAIQ